MTEPRLFTVDRGAYDPAVSPDGSTIAVGILGRIWLLPEQGGTATQLSSGHGWAHHPTWSLDGRRLAWVHDTRSGSEIRLHTFASGTSRTVYGRSPAGVAEGASTFGPVFSVGEMAFHPTDGRLYFVDFRAGIRSLDPDARRAEPEQLVSGSVRLGRPGVTERSSFAFSPDGARIAVERDTTDLWTHLHVAPVGSDEFTQVTAADTVKRTEVRWSPGGDSLVHLALEEGTESLVVRAANGAGDPRRIELGPFNGRELALHPDGERALVVSGRRLVTVDLATGASTPVPFRATLSRPSRESGDLVIINARLFDATEPATSVEGTVSDGVEEGATVVVQDGVITTVTTEPWTGGSSTRVIDARGRFLMPGLVESHAHLSVIGALSQAAVPRLGITSVFDPGSYLPETLNLRDAIDLGVLEGPHVYTSGPTLDGSEGRARPLTIADVTAPEDARALVREWAGLGVDAIKLYAFLEPAAVRAAVDEAHAHGLPVIGDFVRTPWSAALDAGVDGFIHLFDHKWRFISEDQPDPEAGPWAVVEPDSASMDAFFSDVSARGAMFDPTVMASSRHFQAEEFAAALDDPPDSIPRARIVADVLRTMHRHGVRWVAGTDAGASRLLEEMKIYEIIGIPNATILRSATANAARWLRKDDFGTVEPGKRADLILVDGDPLARIRDLENVDLVVKSGRVLLER